MRSQILKTSTVVAAKDQVWCEMAGEAVILNLKSGVYYGLNSVGARVWSLIQEPQTVGAVLEALIEEYEVEPDRCENDLLTLLQEMKNRELIKIDAETHEAVR
jgi:hypothetical protein